MVGPGIRLVTGTLNPAQCIGAEARSITRTLVWCMALWTTRPAQKLKVNGTQPETPYRDSPSPSCSRVQFVLISFGDQSGLIHRVQRAGSTSAKQIIEIALMQSI